LTCKSKYASKIYPNNKNHKSPVIQKKPSFQPLTNKHIYSKLITKTIEVLKPVSTLLLTGGVGGNVNQFSSVRLGLEFVSAKGWAVDYDLLQNVHSVNLGLRLVRLGVKKSDFRENLVVVINTK
jgi:hypothetical protein